MTFEEYTSLDDTEKKAVFDSLTEANAKLTDTEAERDSFRSENDKLIADAKDLKEELRKTKELNFTLARNNGRDEAPSAEDILHNMFN